VVSFFPPLRVFTLTGALMACAIASCSGKTDGGPPQSPGSMAGKGASTTAGGADDGPLVPAQAGGAASDSLGGEGAASPMPDAPLRGPAFFDFDCSPDGQLPEANACADCQRASCSAELAEALGAQWTSGSASGPCQGWFQCVQACPCNDQPCYASCTRLLGESACEASFLALDTCVTEKCQPHCTATG
jgi:hypothetical protein